MKQWIKFSAALLAAALVCLSTVAAQPFGLMLEWYENQTHIVFSVASQLGYYAEEGLDVKIVSPGMDSAAPIRALLAGEVQVAYTEPSYLVDALLQGNDLVVFGQFLHQAPWVWYGLGDTCAWQTPADFKGLRIRDFRDFPQGLWLQKVLRMYGVNPDTDVNWVGVQPGLQPLLNHDVDVSEGYIVNEPYSVVASGNEGGYIFAGSLMDIDGGLLITTRQQLRDHPAWFTAFMRANVKAAQLCEIDPAAAANAVVARLPSFTFDQVYNPLLLMLQTVYRNPASGIVGDFAVDAGRLQNTIRWLYYIGYMDETVNAVDFIVPGFSGR